MTAPGLQITWAHSRSAQLSHAKAHHVHPTLHWGLSPRPAQSSWTPVACRGLKDTLEKKVWSKRGWVSHNRQVRPLLRSSNTISGLG